MLLRILRIALILQALTCTNRPNRLAARKKDVVAQTLLVRHYGIIWPKSGRLLTSGFEYIFDGIFVFVTLQRQIVDASAESRRWNVHVQCIPTIVNIEASLPTYLEPPKLLSVFEARET